MNAALLANKQLYAIVFNFSRRGTLYFGSVELLLASERYLRPSTATPPFELLNACGMYVVRTHYT